MDLTPYRLTAEPYYHPSGHEIALYEHAYAHRLPLVLKGPTGCGKTRFVEYMAWRLGKPLITLACNEDMTAADLVGRYLLDAEGTRWHDGPLTTAVRHGAICYLDEVVEARQDTTVVIHPLTDSRRILPLDKKGEIVAAHPDFQLVVSYNPGYQSHSKSLKQSTRQRFAALEFDYPAAEAEADIVAHEAGIDRALAPRLAALGHLMHAFGIDDGDVQALERPPQDGPAPRPVLHGATLLLPEAPPQWAMAAEDLHLAATLHAIGHLRHSPRRQPTGNRKPMSLALAGAIEDVRVDRLLMRRHPGLVRLFHRLLRGQPELPQVGFEALVARLQRVLLDPQADDDNAWVRKGRALFEVRAARLDEAEAFRDVVSVLANDLGQLRVRMNLQTYAPPLPWHDDNSHLWAQGADAEQAETTLRRPPPQGEPQPVPPQAPEGASGPAPLPELARHDYPEWHYRLDRARDNWCTVIERAVPPGVVSAPLRPARAPLRLACSRRLDRSQRIRRQWEGDELDLDAATEVFIDRRLGLAPDPRLFRRHGRAAPRTSLLLLLDLSASTADLQPCGRSVLDLEREAAALLMEALRDREDRLEVAGFDSDGRQAVSYLRLLEFGQPVPPDPLAVLGAARPGLSTRLGAALRHATARLAKETSAQRTLLVLSDGAPSDIDVFDARHLVEDAAHAVVEARRKGVRCFCLSLDRASEADVRRIFGHGGYRIVDDPARLGALLARSYAELADTR